MKKIIIENKYLILLWSIALFGIALTYAHHGHLIIDNGREVYYPSQILAGKILYKDIFNIYGPFSYMYNAFLLKIFGANLNVFYLSGCISSIAVVSLIYLIAKRFLPEFLSFTIALFTISIGIFNLKLFNFIFPYSYAMLYGIVAFLLSFLFLLKYKDFPQKTLYLYICVFSAGVCVASKYDFLPYLAVVFYTIFTEKHLKLKEYYYVFFLLFCVPVYCFGTLFLQGVTLNDLYVSLQTINKMSQTKTLEYMYQHNGVFFHPQTLQFLIVEFIKTIIPLGLLLLSVGRKKIVSILLIIIALLLMLVLINVSTFSFLPVLITVWLVLDFKNIKKSKKLLVLTITAVLLSLKTFWGAIAFSYGNYALSFLILTVFALISYRFKDKKIDYNLLAYYCIFVSVLFVLPSLSQYKQRNNLLVYPKGKIYVEKSFYDSTSELISYIEKNTKKTDKIVIYPEGALINFLTDRKTDDYYNSLIPLYWEVFGDDKVIERFKKTKPEYIIFNNWSNPKDYYFGTICEDYATKFCSYVAGNYKKIKVIDNGFRYLIYKR